jgi:micrococcal nuclease
MFRVLRRIIILVVLTAVIVVGYRFWRTPLFQRKIVQSTQELIERLREGQKTYAWTGPAVVSDVTDGDTVVVKTENHPTVAAHLVGIDAPEFAPDRREKGQPLCQESRDFLANLLNNQAVQMSIVGTDFASRPVVLITKDGVLINVKMVEAGLAEAYDEFGDKLPLKIKHALLNAQADAQANHRGIWGLTNYVRPSEYRIRHRPSRR